MMRVVPQAMAGLLLGVEQVHLLAQLADLLGLGVGGRARDGCGGREEGAMSHERGTGRID